jgi:hypothetical protein
MRASSANAGRRPVQYSGARLLALTLAALFGFLAVSASALHQHRAELGSPQVDCKICSWTHAAGAALGFSMPGNAPLESTDLTVVPPVLPHVSDVLSLPLTRAPPCLSL